MFVGACLYTGVASGFGYYTTGTVGLPHKRQWTEVGGLVWDGVGLCRRSILGVRDRLGGATSTPAGTSCRNDVRIDGLEPLAPAPD